MVNVFKLKRLTSVIFFVFSTVLCFAQNYSLKETKKGAVFYQRLEWESTGVVTQYKVVVEQQKDNRYVKIEEYTTKETYQDVSLDAGHYRFKVIFYNVFGQAAFETKYETFDILAAHQPEIKSKKIDSINLEDSSELVCLNVEVSDINASAVFSLVEEKNPGVIAAEPEKIEINDNKVSVYFNKDKIGPGKYKLVVKNPGGLTDESGTVVIRKKDVVSFDFSLSNNSMCFINDECLTKVFHKSFIPLGLNGTADLFFNLPEEKYLGLELNTSYNYLRYVDANTLYIADLLHIGADISYEQNIKTYEKLKINAGCYAGGGVSLIPCYLQIDSDFDHLLSVLPYFSSGIYSKAIFKNNAYVKIGTELFYVPGVCGADYKIFSLNLLAGGGIKL